MLGNHHLVRPHASEHERGRDDVPRVPCTSTTAATAQTRNCGESTLPRATNATIAAAE